MTNKTSKKSNVAAILPIKKEATDINASKEDSKTQKKAPTIPQELETVLGAINWLTIHSPQHRHLFISDLEWSIIPPVMLKQFKLFKDQDNKTVAFASWAKISQEVEERILKTGNTKLAPKDWNCGDIIHLIDVLTPFGGNRNIVTTLYETEFKDKQEVSIVRPKKDGKGLEKVSLKDLIEENKQKS
jgi:cytolysin-activating lysine-acyltransferase